MQLKEKILVDLKEAMKAGEAEKRDTLRLLSSAVKNEEIVKIKREGGLEDSEVMEVIARMIKQRKDSVEQYEKGGRMDLAEKEKKEIAILMVYLPAQLGEEEVKKAVTDILATLDEAKKSNFGSVMQEVMKELKGKADGKMIKEAIEEMIKK
jgi:uncharacterized protein YqeY